MPKMLGSGGEGVQRGHPREVTSHFPSHCLSPSLLVSAHALRQKPKNKPKTSHFTVSFSEPERDLLHPGESHPLIRTISHLRRSTSNTFNTAGQKPHEAEGSVCARVREVRVCVCVCTRAHRRARAHPGSQTGWEQGRCCSPADRRGCTAARRVSPGPALVQREHGASAPCEWVLPTGPSRTRPAPS